MKTCCRCKHSKELFDFGKNSATSDGLMSSCRLCVRAAAKVARLKNPQRHRDYVRKSKFKSPENTAKVWARTKKWKLEHPEAVKEHEREKYRRHFVRMDAASREWVAANPEIARSIKRKSGLKRKYGLTQAEWTRMFVDQRGACAVCQVVCRLCVDHDHKTGKVRALLCHGCNTSLGFLKESVTTIRTLADYLDKHQNQPTT